MTVVIYESEEKTYLNLTTTSINYTVILNDLKDLKMTLVEPKEYLIQII